MPLCHLRPLIEHMPAVEAAELRAWLPVVAFPRLEAQERRRFDRELQRRSRVFRPTPAAQQSEIIEHDPEKAAAWFRQQGIDVDG